MLPEPASPGRLHMFSEPSPWDADTHIFAHLLEKDPELPSLDRLEVLKEALGLVAELWPVPGHSTVQLETHQWVRLRKVLLAIPDLVAADE